MTIYVLLDCQGLQNYVVGLYSTLEKTMERGHEHCFAYSDWEFEQLAANYWVAKLKPDNSRFSRKLTIYAYELDSNEKVMAEFPEKQAL